MTAHIEELRDLVDTIAAEEHVPGAAVGVHVDGSDHVVTTGVTNVDAPVPVDEHTLFQIGSTTKTVTGTAVMSLAEQGLLDIDAPVRKYLPELRLADEQAAEQLTVRHLLTHGGGFLGDVDEGDGWGEDALAGSLGVLATAPQLFAPGAAFSYSNGGFLLLGRLIEVVCGEPYEAASRRLVLEPLGMTESFFLPWEVYSRRHAVGHVVRDGAAEVAHTMGIARPGNAVGGLFCSVRDQLAYARFHLAGSCPGAAPVSDATRLLMQAPAAPAGPPLTGVGLPWLLQELGGLPAVTHGGNISNIQLSTLVMLPDRAFAVTTLTNAGGGRRLGEAVTRWCVEELLGLPATPQRAVRQLGEPELAEYAGSYDVGQWTWVVTPQAPGLHVDAVLRPELVAAGVENLPAMDLVFVGPDELARPADTSTVVARFLRDESGRITFLHAGMRASARM